MRYAYCLHENKICYAFNTVEDWNFYTDIFDIDMKYGGFLYLWHQTCWYDIFNGEHCKKWNKRIKKWLREEMSVYFSRACRAAYFTQGHVYIYLIYIQMHVIYVFLL